MYFNEELSRFLLSNKKEISNELDFIKNFNHRDEYYKIKRYLDDFLNDSIDERFIVLPGLRGVGKTTLVLQLYQYLISEKKINPNNILYLSMDQITKVFKTDLLTVLDIFLKESHNTTRAFLKEKIFVFVDESHFDYEWGISGKIIYDTSKNIFLIFTGSSAVELEINGDIARRINKEAIYPLNFKEYLLLKHNISIKSEFSKNLMKMIVFGEKEDIENVIESEKEIHSKLLDLNNDTEIEFLNFLKTYGFPFTLNSKVEEAYKKIYTIIENSIEKDIPSIKTFNFDTYNNIRRILIYIALQKPEGTSSGQLANYLSISSSTVREILDTLEKTQLIFSVKPYGESSKIIKKPWIYYFLSPSIKTAINSEMGRYDFNNPHFLASLAENLVAIALYKMIKTEFRLIGLFYPPNKGSSDFILRTNFDNLVPIEVGLGNKKETQIKKDMEKYKCKYGILVSNKFNKIEINNNIIHIPLLYFGFI